VVKIGQPSLVPPPSKPHSETRRKQERNGWQRIDDGSGHHRAPRDVKTVAFGETGIGKCRLRLKTSGLGYVVTRIVSGSPLALSPGNPTNRIGDDIDEKN